MRDDKTDSHTIQLEICEKIERLGERNASK